MKKLETLLTDHAGPQYAKGQLGWVYYCRCEKVFHTKDSCIAIRDWVKHVAELAERAGIKGGGE